MNDNELVENINTLYNLYIENENNFTNILSIFYNNVYDLVNLSNGKYQIENTIKLNKVSIKGYILESDFVKHLNNINIKEFKLNDLKKYLIQTQNENNEHLLLAIKLYELLDQLEIIEKNEIDDLIDYIQIITGISIRNKLTNKDELAVIYSLLSNKIGEYEKNKLIDENLKNRFLDCLNVLFNYYINGSRKIVNNI